MKALEDLLEKYENDLATFTDLLDSCNPNNRLKIEKLRYKVNCHKNMVNDLRSVLAEVANTESKLNMPVVSVPKGTVCVHPVKFVVWCEDDGMYWCNKCEQYVTQTAR